MCENLKRDVDAESAVYSNRGYTCLERAFLTEVQGPRRRFYGKAIAVQQNTSIDAMDRKILDVLQPNGRISNRRLSELVSLSPSACLARVRRLERAEVITGYKAQVDPAKLGSNLTMFAELTVSGHHLAITRRIEQTLLDMPEAIEAFQVSGNYDFLVRFLVPDMERWTDLADELADSDLTIETVRTVASMRRIKGWVGVPLGPAAGTDRL